MLLITLEWYKKEVAFLRKLYLLFLLSIILSFSACSNQLETSLNKETDGLNLKVSLLDGENENLKNELKQINQQKTIPPTETINTVESSTPIPTFSPTPTPTPTQTPIPTQTPTPSPMPSLSPSPSPLLKSTYTPTTESQKKEIIVYVTKTGAKYHQAGCRYLSKSKIAINLEHAKKQYSPCSVCNPPQ